MRSRLLAVPAWAWLAAIVVVSTGFRFELTRRLPGPFIFVDELVYSELAKSFADSGRFLVRDVSTSGYGVVYPALISPAYRLFRDVPQAYAAAKGINSLLMSLAAVPTYLLARRVLGPGVSLLAAVLAVALPSMVYTGTVMTENAFYPLFLLVALVLVLTLERPTAPRQVALLLLVGVAYLTRAQSLAFVPAVLVAPVLFGLVGERRLRAALRPFLPLFALALAGAVAVVGAQVARGRPLRDLLGAYSIVGDQRYSVRAVTDFTLWHAADLALYVGVIPLAATLLLLWRVRRETRPVQAFLAASVPLAVSFTLVVAAFSTRFASDRIHERNLFELAPLLLIGLLVWCARLEGGAARAWPVAAGAVAVAALLPVTIPYGRFIGDPSRADTLALVPVWTINEHFLAGSPRLTVGLVCAGLGLLVLAVPRRAALALPLVVLAWFALLLDPVFSGPHGFEASSQGAVFSGIRGVDRDWIDDAVPAGAHVAALWTGTSDRFTINQNEFFNRSVGRIYYTAQPTPGGLYERHVTFGPNGLARTDGGAPLRPGYILTDGSVTPEGVPVARDPALGMAVWRVRGTLVSMHSTVTGLYANDTWSGPTATWSARPCRGGTLRVTLASDPHLFTRPPRVTATSGAALVATRVPLVGTVDLRIPTSPHGGTCVVRFSVAPTRVPRVVTGGKNSDPRRLGAHFLVFDFRPR